MAVVMNAGIVERLPASQVIIIGRIHFSLVRGKVTFIDTTGIISAFLKYLTSFLSPSTHLGSFFFSPHAVS